MEEIKLKRGQHKIHPTPFQGYYKENFLRSYPEFLYALYLDFVEKVTFKTEPLQLYSLVINKRKIPDFMYIKNINGKEEIFLSEIKSDANKTEETLIDYATNRYHFKIKDQICSINICHKINFVTIDAKGKRFYIDKIIKVIGKDKFNELSDEFKNQRNKVYSGFPGELNPMFGRTQSEETKNKTRTTRKANGTYDTHGEKNSNYGNHLSEEAKIKVGAKWYDPEKKRKMKIKGMLTHFSRVNPEQKELLYKYIGEALLDDNVKVPSFINGIYKINLTKVLDLFGSIDNFLNQVGISNGEAIIN